MVENLKLGEKGDHEQLTELMYIIICVRNYEDNQYSRQRQNF